MSQANDDARDREVEELRKEVTELRGGTDRKRSGSGRGRRWAAVVLLVLACIIAPLAALSIWLRNQVTDTDRYVRTVAPLADHPAIQAATATAVANQLFSRVDVAEQAREALPPRAAFLAEPIANGVRTLTIEATKRLMDSETFQALWVQENRFAHGQLVRVLTGDDQGVVQSQNGQVVLELAPTVEAVKERLAARGVTVFDRVDPASIQSSFVLLDSDGLEQSQNGVKLLKALAIVLPVLFAVLLAAAIALSTGRRRTVLQAGLGVALAMVALGALLTIGRSIYLDYATGAAMPHDAAAAFYDTVVHWLRVGIRAIAGLAILVALAAFLTGPSRLATGIRMRFNRHVVRAQTASGVGDSSVGRWVGEHKTVLRLASVGVPAIIFIAWDLPSPTVLIVLTAVALVLLLVVEVLGRSSEAPTESAPTA